MSGGIPGPLRVGGNDNEEGDGRIVGTLDVGGID